MDTSRLGASYLIKMVTTTVHRHQLWQHVSHCRPYFCELDIIVVVLWGVEKDFVFKHLSRYKRRLIARSFSDKTKNREWFYPSRKRRRRLFLIRLCTHFDTREFLVWRFCNFRYDAASSSPKSTVTICKTKFHI